MNTNLRKFAVHSNDWLRNCGGAFIALSSLALSVAQAQITNYTLGTSTLLVGPGAEPNSVVLAVTPATGTWTATTNAPWLHLSPANQSGIGSTNVVFSYDANPGATRSGTLTIAGQTLTVTQAGSTYINPGRVTALVASGLNSPGGVAVDSANNVYFSDSGNRAIKMWTAADNTVTTLGPPGYPGLVGVAVDGSGMFISPTGTHT